MQRQIKDIDKLYINGSIEQKCKELGLKLQLCWLFQIVAK